MKKNFSIILVLLTVIGFCNLASAQSITGLKVSPAFIEDKVIVGEKVVQSIKLSNRGNTDRLLVLEIRDIVGFASNGQPLFADDSSALKTGISAWLSLPAESLDLSANSSQDLSFTISVPEQTALGRHQGGLFIRDIANQDYELGVIISLFVQGEFDEALEVLTFTASDFLYSQPVVDFYLLLENRGNSILRPQGVITITNLFGREVARLEVNSRGFPLAPGENERFNLSWQGAKFNWGRYQAVFSSAYGQGNHLITASNSLWILPLNVILIIFLLVIVLIFALVLTMRWLIKKKALEYYKRSSESQGRGYSKEEIPEIITNTNFNLKRLLLITVSLLILILVLLSVLYFV